METGLSLADSGFKLVKNGIKMVDDGVSSADKVGAEWVDGWWRTG